MKAYLWNVFVSLDQAANTILGPFLNFMFRVDGFGYPDETLSSVFGKYQDVCALCLGICWLLDRIDPGHCKNSIETDEGKTVD